ncbi:enoyl-CoA hydratase/isomerase family protein [Hydrogenophaga sp.]|jgi:enoyl-CoA hydratase/carnithine racemase|uniref:enoyl-CoA hydratase/isomerase family protein n=1 Tax=Hydrogenophaga sp. TaxID=1904254 RepID=UPI003F6EB692
MQTPDYAVANAAARLSQPERGIWLFEMTRAEEMNTLTLELLDALERSISHCRNQSARALVITGAGRAFCCGAHLRYFAGDGAILTEPLIARDRYLSRIAALFDELEECAFPTIAAINGFALGGGCELVLSCDLRVFGEHVRIGLPETKLGAIAGAGGVQKLVRHVGRSKAIEWILLARQVSAQQAAAEGLVTALVAPEAVLPTAMALARELRSLAPRAIGQSKATIYSSEDADLRTARRHGLEALSILVGGAEWQEGMSAFVEKRAPGFDQW